MDEFTALASLQLERVKALCSQIDLTYTEMPTPIIGVGVGIAIGFSEIDYTICSILAGGNESHLMLTSGILKDITQSREIALPIVNRFNQQNSSYTVYLHDAEAGWSLLVQRATPIEVFLDSPAYLGGLARGLPIEVQKFRTELAQESTLGGQPWNWSDRNDLLTRSML